MGLLGAAVALRVQLSHAAACCTPPCLAPDAQLPHVVSSHLTHTAFITPLQTRSRRAASGARLWPSSAWARPGSSRSGRTRRARGLGWGLGLRAGSRQQLGAVQDAAARGQAGACSSASCQSACCVPTANPRHPHVLAVCRAPRAATSWTRCPGCWACLCTTATSRWGRGGLLVLPAGLGWAGHPPAQTLRLWQHARPASRHEHHYSSFTAGRRHGAVLERQGAGAQPPVAPPRRHSGPGVLAPAGRALRRARLHPALLSSAEWAAAAVATPQPAPARPSQAAGC